jgi:hypothetical protein
MALFLSGGCVVGQRSTYRKGQRHSFLVAAKGLLYGLSLLIFLLAMGIWVRRALSQPSDVRRKFGCASVAEWLDHAGC